MCDSIASARHTFFKFEPYSDVTREYFDFCRPPAMLHSKLEKNRDGRVLRLFAELSPYRNGTESRRSCADSSSTGLISSNSTVSTTLVGKSTMPIPRSLLEALRKIIPPLDGSLHKGQSGRVGVIGGAQEYAPILSPYLSILNTRRIVTPAHRSSLPYPHCGRVQICPMSSAHLLRPTRSRLMLQT